jgi:hypothetical protein
LYGWNNEEQFKSELLFPAGYESRLNDNETLAIKEQGLP